MALPIIKVTGQGSRSSELRPARQRREKHITSSPLMIRSRLVQLLALSCRPSLMQHHSLQAEVMRTCLAPRRPNARRGLMPLGSWQPDWRGLEVALYLLWGSVRDVQDAAGRVGLIVWLLLDRNLPFRPLSCSCSRPVFVDEGSFDDDVMPRQGNLVEDGETFTALLAAANRTAGGGSEVVP
jgi:hypothetical protein